jgi:hypothetical protein
MTWMFAVAWLATAAGFLGLKVWRAWQNWRDLVDFSLYYSGAWLARHGSSPFDIVRLQAASAYLGFAQPVGPPLSIPVPTLLLMAPFTFLEPRLAAALWVLMSGILISGAAVVVLGTGRPLRFTPTLLVCMGLPALFWPAQSTLGLGQVNALTLVFIAAALWAAARERPAWVGVAVGLATLTKLGPGLLLLYLLASRRFRAAAAAIATVTAGLLASAAWLGTGAFAAYLHALDWVNQKYPALVSDSPFNLSLASLPYRLLALAHSLGLSAGSAGPDVARWTGRLAGLALAAFAIRRGIAMRDLGRALTLLVPAYLLVMPYSTPHQAIVMLLVYWQVLALDGGAGRRVAGLALASYLLLDLHWFACAVYFDLRSPVSPAEMISREIGSLGLVVGLCCAWFMPLPNRVGRAAPGGAPAAPVLSGPDPAA